MGRHWRSICDLGMALEYYQAAFENRRPEYVPKKVLVVKGVRSEMPIAGNVNYLEPGEYEVYSNPNGAISALLPRDERFGLKPGEFEVLEWKRNPHFDKE